MAATSTRQPPRTGEDDTFADAEPPPAYSAVANPHEGTQTLEANFARPYEVSDAGLFQAPAHPPPRIAAHNTGASTSHGTFLHPPGPPPGPRSASPSGNHNPPLPPRHPSTASPQPHIDGISTFNRPPLPNQVAAHTAPPTSPAQQQLKYAPTVNPTSGQPLLYKGKLLVYNDNSMCYKCHNSGYKGYDPSVPHIRCWDKYGRQYTSVLQHSPNFDFNNPTLQKPLPNTRYNASLPPMPPQQHPNYFVAGQQQPYQQSFQQQQPYYHQPRPQFGIFQNINGPNPHTVIGAPPPGALVVQPGDRRIGGRLCNYCHGSGQTSGGGFFGLDYETCWTCRGAGRVF